jgi:hypothetical protein
MTMMMDKDEKGNKVEMRMIAKITTDAPMSTFG